MFLTVTLGEADVDVRGLGRVLEDGDISCQGNHTEHSRKVRKGTGQPRKCAGSFPLMPRQYGALNTDSDLQFARTPMSPKEESRKFREGTGYPAEMCWKLTRDVPAIPRAKIRQRLAIRQDADVA